MDLKQMEKELDTLLPSGNYRKITNAKIPTWVSRDGLEGLELLKSGEIKTFWFRDGERNYDEPTNIVFEEIKERYNKKEQKAELQPERSEGDKALVPMMPEYLTEALIEKWKAQPVEARLVLLQNTDSRYIKERPGRAGQTYVYVDGHYMHQAANLAFLYNWGSEITDMKITDTEVIVWGRVWGIINDHLINKASVGQQDIKFRKDSKIPLSLGDDVKAAVTDMEKKGLSKFGIAADVYRGEV